MSDLSKFNRFTSDLKEDGYLMPVLFVGHGSPMNGIEDNEFSDHWKQLAREIPQPAAVLVISAHWLSNGTKVTAMDFPPTIHDFGGFPQALFDVQYPAPGSAKLASETISLLHSVHAEPDHDWGLDHGAWTVVRHMYPEANVPVLQLSIDYSKGPQYHYDLAKDLYSLRKKGVLIMGSGNMVHNLRMVAWDRLNEPGFGFDWAYELNDKFKQLIADGNHQALINFSTISPDILKAIPTSEHYLPLLYNLGLQGKNEEVSFFNDKAVGGSLTMTSVRIG
ncbi:4,5-DOPA dioxygenase extradiol [Daejeonella sp.]|uniref:4,5-DOPA-extradiol-dioxygenase n=1 Tax=Daejeonella sp. TaxID=2805397 RepID=UPI0027167F2B|nr:4,5-DOPA dioxygenase extradiol [Daejeonella sp.]MDO8994155.1 4,5-DOPA dioxygenase extradiol [Daejeonella sp.]MDP2415354.1 4,5-DOPA dioxygenase extradiol [Daejeonella sp.]